MASEQLEASARAWHRNHPLPWVTDWPELAGAYVGFSPWYGAHRELYVLVPVFSPIGPYFTFFLERTTVRSLEEAMSAFPPATTF